MPTLHWIGKPTTQPRFSVSSRSFSERTAFECFDSFEKDELYEASKNLL